MSISEPRAALFFRLSLSITVFSALFKFMPSFLIGMGAMGMVVFLSLQLYQKRERMPLDYARLLLIVAFAMNYATELFGFAAGGRLTLLTKLALIAFLILYIKKIVGSFHELTQNTSLLQGNFDKESLSFILADLATVYIVMASLFKILHWEIGLLNGNVLLAIGLFAALISLFASPRGMNA